MTHDQMKELIACQVCGKPAGVGFDECHATFGKRNPLCNESKNCRIAEKSESQFIYALSEINENIFLKACPGSGKTEVVGLKAAYEIKRWDKDVGGIAVLTFTNNAADVISERVSQFAGVENIKYPHFIGTFDSWLHGYIAHPFGYSVTKYRGKDGDFSIRILDPRSNAGFMANSNFKTKLYPKIGTIKAHEYYLDKEINAYVFYSRSHISLNFSKEDQDDLKVVKKRFIEAGFANYQDIENICFAIFSKNTMVAERLALRFPLIVVDECQDLSWIQLQILKVLKDKGSKLHFVGDLNQAIYEFKKVCPDKVRNFVFDEEFKELLLVNNYRSCQSIVNTCKEIVGEQSEIKGLCNQKLIAPCVCLIYKDKLDLPKLPVWFNQYIVQNNLDINFSAIVARGWSTISKMRLSGNSRATNSSARLAIALYLWHTNNIQAIDESIAYMGHFISDTYFQKYPANSKKYYCPDCVSSSIQWRLFLMEVLEKCILNPSIVDFSKTGSEWAKCVRGDFGYIARKCKSLLSSALSEEVVFFDFDGNNFRAFDAKNPVQLLFPNQATAKSNLLITTIHSVKGKTYDAIMVVSAPTKQGSDDNHWEHWLADNTSEAARLAYVASSRPRYLLVWAVPKGDDKNIAKLKSRGFEVVCLYED